MVFSGEIGQTSYQYYMSTAVAGMLIGQGQHLAMPYLNNASATQGVYTITPPNSVDASTTYSVSIDGVVVAVESGASTTTVQLGTLLFNAIRQEATVYRKVDASLNGSTGVITLTARLYNTAVTITSPSNADTTNDLVIATSTSPGSATEIPFGRFVGRLSTYTVDSVSGLSAAALVSHATNFTVLGPTILTTLEKNAIGSSAETNYPYTRALSVLEDPVAIQGIWCEAVDDDIVPTDSVYIDISSDGGGKVTKTSSSNCNISSRARFITESITGGDGKILVGVRFRR